MSNAEILSALQNAEDPFMRVLGDLLALKLERGQQYNTGGVKLPDYFPLGRASYYQMCHIKVLRMRSMMAQDKEGYLDSCMDLANYTIFAIMGEKP